MPTHEYRVNVAWSGGKDGSGQVEAPESGESFALAVPHEFGGPGGATNPEELLTSAIASCYSITLGIIAQNRKLPIQEMKVAAVGEVDQQGATFTYKRVTIRPTITLSGEATDEQRNQARDMAMKADHYCIITNAVRDKVEVTVEPTLQ
ncbi:MAG TPA: OsmC family protein [Fimbriimonas sp.]|nr:OsmC family protein [Fimbriimonas sp.]